MVRQIPSIPPTDQNAELWQAVRALVARVNEIAVYLVDLAQSYGAAVLTYSQAVSTSTGVWDPLNLSFDASFQEVGWTIASGSRLTASKDMGRGVFFYDFTASNLGNNRTHHVGIRLNGDDGTILSDAFVTRDVVIDFNTSFVVNSITAGDYIEIVVSSDTVETWDIEGRSDHTVVTAAILPGDIGLVAG